MSPPQRRIEDRIRELCANAKSATNDDLEPILQELSQLLRATIEHMRKGATTLLVRGSRCRSLDDEQTIRGVRWKLATGSKRGKVKVCVMSETRVKS
jgi:hypothetical protein